MTLSDSQKNHNSFEIIPAKGASLATIKPQLKDYGCHYQIASERWCCPLLQKSEVEELLANKSIKVSLKDCRDNYFDKTESGKKADNIYVRINVLEKKYHDEDRQLLTTKDLLEKEIQKRDLSELGPLIEEEYCKLEDKEKAQKERRDEIEQLRNSARLLEENKNDTIEWPDLKPIKGELLPAQPFNSEKLLPPSLRAFVCDEADRMPCPPDFIATALIVALGSVIGARCAIKPKSKDSWTVIPNIWGAIVGVPASKKSPALDVALKPLERLMAEARKKHEEALVQYENEKIVFDAQIKGMESRLNKAAINSESNLEILAKELGEHKQKAPNSPIPRRFKSNDTTVEKLGELLKDNPAGLLISRDELVGLWATWDKSGREGERTFYLEAWNGSSSFETDRIGRGSIYIPNLCVALFGGIQPDKLTRYLDQTANSLGNDGMLQRFQMLVYPNSRRYEWSDQEPNRDARNQVHEIFRTIGDENFDPSVWGASKDEHDKFPNFHFDEEAQRIFIEWCKSLHEKMESEDNPLIQQHLAKYEKLFPALSLIFHLIECAIGKEQGAVKASSVIIASAWCGYLESHARRCYGLLADDGLRAAQALSKKIQEGKKIINGFTLRDVRRNQWRYLTTDTVIQSALDWLEDEGWIRPYGSGGTGPGSGRHTTRYQINPKICRSIGKGDPPNERV